MICISTEGDPSFYDFKYNKSIYKVVSSEYTAKHASEICQTTLGINATLIYFENLDEVDFIGKELYTRGLTGYHTYWTRGTIDNTPETMFTTPQPGPDGSPGCKDRSSDR